MDHIYNLRIVVCASIRGLVMEVRVRHLDTSSLPASVVDILQATRYTSSKSQQGLSLDSLDFLQNSDKNYLRWL